MSTATLGTQRPVTEQEYWSLVLGEHATAAAGNPNFVRSGGVYNPTPTAATGTRDVVTWHDPYGYSVVHRDSVQVASFTTAASASTNTGTISGMAALSHLTVLTDISASAGVLGTMNVLIDTDLGASGTWISIAQSSIYTAGGLYAMQLAKPQATNLESTLTADAGAGTLRRMGWGNNIRIRAVVVGTATTTMSAIIYVSGVM